MLSNIGPGGERSLWFAGSISSQCCRHQWPKNYILRCILKCGGKKKKKKITWNTQHHQNLLQCSRACSPPRQHTPLLSSTKSCLPIAMIFQFFPCWSFEMCEIAPCLNLFFFSDNRKLTVILYAYYECSVSLLYGSYLLFGHFFLLLTCMDFF